MSMAILPLSLFVLAVGLLHTATSYTDFDCNRYNPGYQACTPIFHSNCPCGVPFFVHRPGNGELCCSPDWMRDTHCANIDLTVYPQFRTCGHNPYCQWSGWTYSPCSASCGTGTRQGTRQCPYANVYDKHYYRWYHYTETVTTSCTVNPAAAWTAWTQFGTCSSSCGAGVQTRSRSCLGGCAGSCTIGDTQTEQQNCTVGVPYAWTAWSDFGPCSNVCGAGTQNRTRLCVGNCDYGGECTAGSVDMQSADCVGSMPASWAKWTLWGACSGCGLGTQSRTRRCEGNCDGDCELAVVEQESKLCAGTSSSVWSRWTSWGIWCSADCGDGIVSRQRFCEGEGDGGVWRSTIHGFPHLQANAPVAAHLLGRRNCKIEAA